MFVRQVPFVYSSLGVTLKRLLKPRLSPIRKLMNQPSSLNNTKNNAVVAVNSTVAADIDKQLMSNKYGFTLPQLMELAGFSVSQVVYREYPLDNCGNNKVFIIVGSGNNGGDGLVCARHLKLFGYEPIVYYPTYTKSISKQPFYNNLTLQLEEMFEIPIFKAPIDKPSLTKYLAECRCVVDGVFGFSFKPPIRKDSVFFPIMEAMVEYSNANGKGSGNVISIDIPSGWDVDKGPLSLTNDDHAKYVQPKVLISLTVPKLCTHFLDPTFTKHYVGGRFISGPFAESLGFKSFDYKGTDQILELKMK
ncbi:related to NAD(P)H-hydrate epimerase [Saccharomycodes ludwigii]|uniref:NAD(P)H-hydrate epimerase n=1 Tax=Saccharomycodes ludwigii TaxID=36035 RepID=A0A376BB08_9ASCO|nr:hypothetical protein SCDLUD_002999 [Saccharomycodes ludwigii]KAH3901503.1 hypothetical protein SCDLUD_002999 [Saccharomycodes ludwigii]SSD61817.1 related to NAD(P)H-hydrate epimerase [Saccharomycodes ludwigii]